LSGLAFFLLITLLILYLPITWAIVFYWSNKSKKYWIPAASCVLAHVAILPLLVIFNVVDISDDFDIALLILLIILFLLSGIAISALVVLYVTKHRVWVLSILIAFSVIAISPLLDYVDFDPATYTVSLLQGSETEFKGHKVHLGSSYVYYQSGDDYLGIRKINPGFKGIDYDYWIAIKPGTKEEVEKLHRDCWLEQTTCIASEEKNYTVLSLMKRTNGENDKFTYDTYDTVNSHYNLNCDLYLTHSDYIFDERYTEFIERFFNDCS